MTQLNLLEWFDDTGPSIVQHKYLVNGRDLPGATGSGSFELLESENGTVWSASSSVTAPSIPFFEFDQYDPFTTNGSIIVLGIYDDTDYVVSTTTDGQTWSEMIRVPIPQDDPTTGSFLSFRYSPPIWTGNRFIAYVSNYDQTNVTHITSTDGVTWSSTAGAAVPWMDYNNTTGTASGYNSAWTLHSPSPGTVWAIRKFTAVQSDGSIGELWVSTDDGATWGSMSTLNPTIPLRNPPHSSRGSSFDLNIVNNRLFVMTRDGAATTTDCVNWDVITMSFQVNSTTYGYQQTFKNICYGAGRYWWVRSFRTTSGGQTAARAFCSSVDGITWTVHSDGLVADPDVVSWVRPLTNTHVVLMVGGMVHTTSDGVTLTPAPGVLTPKKANNLGYTPGWLSLGGTGYLVGSDQRVYSTTDGTTFTTAFELGDRADALSTDIETDNYGARKQDSMALCSSSSIALCTIDGKVRSGTNLNTKDIAIVVSSTGIVPLVSTTTPFSGTLSQTSTVVSNDRIVFADTKSTKSFIPSTSSWYPLGQPSQGLYFAHTIDSGGNLIRVDLAEGTVRSLDIQDTSAGWTDVTPRDIERLRFAKQLRPNPTGPRFLFDTTDSVFAGAFVDDGSTVSAIPHYFTDVTYHSATSTYYAVEDVIISSSTRYFRVYTSSDGLAWTLLSSRESTDGNTNNDARQILVFDSNTIVVIRQWDIVRTTDGGSTWAATDISAGAGNTRYVKCGSTLVEARISRSYTPDLLVRTSTNFGATFTTAANYTTGTSTFSYSGVSSYSVRDVIALNDDQVMFLLVPQVTTAETLIYTISTNTWVEGSHPTGYRWGVVTIGNRRPDWVQIGSTVYALGTSALTNTTGLYSTTDGQTWQTIDTPYGDIQMLTTGPAGVLRISGVPLWANGTVEDPIDPTSFFTNTNYSALGYTESGDGGATWSAIPPMEGVIHSRGYEDWPRPQIITVGSTYYVRGLHRVWSTTDFVSYTVVAEVEDLSSSYFTNDSRDWFVDLAYDTIDSQLILITALGHVFTSPTAVSWTERTRVSVAMPWPANNQAEPDQDPVPEFSTDVSPILSGVITTNPTPTSRYYVAYGEGFALSVTTDLETWTPISLGSVDGESWSVDGSGTSPFNVGYVGDNNGSPNVYYATIEKIEWSSELGQFIVVAKAPPAIGGL